MAPPVHKMTDSRYPPPNLSCKFGNMTRHRSLRKLHASTRRLSSANVNEPIFTPPPMLMDLVHELVGSGSEIDHDLGLFLAEADHRVQDAGDVPERDAWDDEYRKSATVSPKLGWVKKHRWSYDLPRYTPFFVKNTFPVSRLMPHPTVSLAW